MLLGRQSCEPRGVILMLILTNRSAADCAPPRMRGIISSHSRGKFIPPFDSFHLDADRVRNVDDLTDVELERREG